MSGEKQAAAGAGGSAPLFGREYVNASTRRRAVCVSHEMMGSVVMQNTTAPEIGKRWIAEVEWLRRNWIEAERQLEMSPNAPAQPRREGGAA